MKIKSFIKLPRIKVVFQKINIYCKIKMPVPSKPLYLTLMLLPLTRPSQTPPASFVTNTKAKFFSVRTAGKTLTCVALSRPTNYSSKPPDSNLERTLSFVLAVKVRASSRGILPNWKKKRFPKVKFTKSLKLIKIFIGLLPDNATSLTI